MYSSYSEISHKIKNVKGYLVKGEEDFLFNKAKSLPDNSLILEIGSFRGLSTVIMGYACKGSSKKIYCIDPWTSDSLEETNEESINNSESVFDEWHRNIKEHELEEYVIPLRGYSYDILNKWEELVGKKEVDFIFIDGLHKYWAVTKDFNMSLPILKQGGFIALQDVASYIDGPEKLWFETSIKKLINHEYCKSIACGHKPFLNLEEVKKNLQTLKELNRYEISDNYIKGLISEYPYFIDLLTLRAKNCYDYNDKVISKQILLDLHHNYPNNIEISNMLSIVLWETGYIQKSLDIIEKNIDKKDELNIINYTKILEYNSFNEKLNILSKTIENEQLKFYINNKLSNLLEKSIVECNQKSKLNTNNYLISIIIPILESTVHLKTFINNFINQTIFNQIEIKIVYSNLSYLEEVELKKIISNHKNISSIKKENNINLFKTLNEVIPILKSEFVSVCFPEERPIKNAYELIYNELESNEEVSLIYSNYSNSLNKNDIREMFEWNRQDLFWKGSLETQTVWRKSIHKEFGYFDTNLEFAGFYDFYLKISQTHKLKKIPLPLFENDLSSLNIRKRVFPADIEIYFYNNYNNNNLFNDNFHKKEFFKVIYKYTKAKYDNTIIGSLKTFPTLSFNLDQSDLNVNNSKIKNTNIFIRSNFLIKNKYLEKSGYYILSTSYILQEEDEVNYLNQVADLVLVPTNDLKNNYIENGVLEDKIFVSDNYESLINEINNLINKPILRFSIEKLSLELFNKGKNEFENSNFIESSKTFSKLSKYKKEERFLYFHALSNIELEVYDLAIDILYDLIEMNPYNKDAYKMMALCLEKTGDHENSKIYYSKFEEL